MRDAITVLEAQWKRNLEDLEEDRLRLQQQVLE